MRAFVSYRRDDSRPITERICDRLFEHFGEAAVFKDVNSIAIGTDFRYALNQALDTCNSFLAIIGPRWLGQDPGWSVRRIDDENDFVRLEVATALQRQIAIIPVLVDGAPIPSQRELPSLLAGLGNLQALSVRHDPDFQGDIAYLIRTLVERHVIDELIVQMDKAPSDSLLGPVEEESLHQRFTEHHDRDHGNPLALVKRGILAYTWARTRGGGYRRAVEDFRTAIGIDSKLADPHFGIGTVYYDVAIADLIRRKRFRLNRKGKLRVNPTTGQPEMIAPDVELFFDKQSHAILMIALDELQTGMALRQASNPVAKAMAYEYVPSDVMNRIMSLRTMLGYQPLREPDQTMITILSMLANRMGSDEGECMFEIVDGGQGA